MLRNANMGSTCGRVQRVPLLFRRASTTSFLVLSTAHSQSANRPHSLRLDLQWLREAAGVEYKTPHKLRHGHVVHAIQNAHTPADLKAINQNVMHSNLATTDGVYGILQDRDTGTRIGRMGGEAAVTPQNAALIAQLETLLAQLKKEG